MSSGTTLAQKGRFEEAMAHFAQVLLINPEHAGAHNNLGLALAHKGNLDDAIIHFSEAVRINPRYGDAHHNLRLSLKEQERLKKGSLSSGTKNH